MEALGRMLTTRDMLCGERDYGECSFSCKPKLLFKNKAHFLNLEMTESRQWFNTHLSKVESPKRL